MTTTTAAATPITVDAAGVSLSGRAAEPAGPSRGLIVAMHGGTYDSGYYDVGPDSLLALGPRLDYTVVAVDRPGYGAATDVDDAHKSFAGQTAVLVAAVDELVARYGGPVVLIGHSIGGMMALRTAGAMSTPPAGVEVSGLGELWQPGLREMWSSLIGDAPAVSLPAEGHAQVMFGEENTFDAGSVTVDAELLRPLPMPELVDVVAWSEQLPQVGAAISAPVSLTLAEQDRIWQSDDAARTALAGHFTAAASVDIDLFTGAGHSIELHRRARAYALHQLAFAEDCLSRV
ncbi:alpha/beta hydrolase [Gordonia sp. TBRC 11910]|uniref:Alpha/beta hydrolase n=1 Tax=Gordonia asplenii TaxID=2725283 RepID=A0A848KWA0_9ACTN|nr:alpha/beta hydrolase [Gordonia asplenii]NMO02946.1 alpha/beta hydrolase [Gordonia asplenii]